MSAPVQGVEPRPEPSLRLTLDPCRFCGADPLAPLGELCGPEDFHQFESSGSCSIEMAGSPSPSVISIEDRPGSTNDRGAA